MFVLLWHRQNHEYQKYDGIPLLKKAIRHEQSKLLAAMVINEFVVDLRLLVCPELYSPILRKT